MFLLAYLLVLAIVWLLVLAISSPTRSRLARYTTMAVVYSLVLVGLFYSLSWASGLIQFGIAQDWSYPQDFLSRGAAGVLIMLLPIIGVLSPLLAAWMVRSQPRPAD